METERNEFDVRMPQVTYASGKAMICINEEMAAYPKTEDTEERTAYVYDTLWVECDANNEESVRKSLAHKLEQCIKEYDISKNVNSFTLGGKQMWLDKDTRVGLMNSINIEQAAKKTDTVLWFDGLCYRILIDTALQMLSSLELYALACYNVTQQHLSAISNISTIEELVGYDYTIGYPERLDFDI